MSLKVFAKQGLVRDGVDRQTSTLLAIRLIYPYMLAVFLCPLVSRLACATD